MATKHSVSLKPQAEVTNSIYPSADSDWLAMAPWDSVFKKILRLGPGWVGKVDSVIECSILD